MRLQDIGATLPPGFRFYPTDEELVCHYLYRKIAKQEILKGTFIEIDLHTCEPWQLPEVAKLNTGEWYFFSFRDRKYATGYRTNRSTTSGYWKATGKDRSVKHPGSGKVVGMRKTLVFYRSRAPNGIKTAWIMHEFRLETPNRPPKEDWVLCRVFNKGKGKPTSFHYSPRFGGETATSKTGNSDEQIIQSTCHDCLPVTSSFSTETNQKSDEGELLGLFGLAQEENVIGEKDEDDYGFLWEGVAIEEAAFGGGN